MKEYQRRNIETTPAQNYECFLRTLPFQSLKPSDGLSRNFILSKQVQHPFVKKDLFRFSPQKLEKTYRDETSRDLLYWTLNSYITGIVYSKTNKRHKIE